MGLIFYMGISDAEFSGVVYGGLLKIFWGGRGNFSLGKCARGIV